MSILKRGIVTFSFIIIFAILVTFLISHFIIDKGFLELEKENTSRVLSQIEQNLLTQGSNLLAINDDWASWDDTYYFIENKNDEYITSNLIDETFTTLNIDFMIFTSQSGEVVFDKAVDYEYNKFTSSFLGEKTNLSEELSEYINNDNILMVHKTQDSEISGLITLDDRPVLISSQPILKSNDSGPAKGILIMGRFLDDEEIEGLASIAFTTVRLLSAGSPELPEGLLDDSGRDSPYEIFIVPENENIISGYKTLNDIEGNPSFVLRVGLSRDIYNKGQATELIILVIVTSIILVCGLLIFLIIYRFLLKRLRNLNFEVKNIGEEKDFTRRIYIRGRDELSTLSSSINSMLDELNDVQSSLRQSEERYRSLFENSLDGIYISTLDGNYIDVNPSLVRMLGYESREELLSRNIPKEVYYSSEERPSREDRNRIFETRLRRKDGEQILVEISSRVIHNSKGNSFYQGIIRDITLRKKAEEKIRLLSFHDELTGLYNRAYFEEELIRLNTKRQLPLSIIMGDVNGLKLTNDAFGHKQGDELLKRCARIFEECSREDDIVARWGGDEFIILLPKTIRDNALKIIERVNERCRTSELNGIPISISLGVDTRISEEQDVEKVLKKAEDMMYRRKLIERRSVTSTIVASLEKTLWEKSGETREHAVRVRELSKRLGREAGLDKGGLADLGLLAVIHDVGKIAIPDEILSKSGELTPEEWEIIKRHPEVGFNIAQSTTQLAPVAEAILAHHERWDGKGYPQGLKSREIPLISRIVAIIDAFDVMTNGTPYREPLDREDALKRIEAGAGTIYDPGLVKKFAGLIDNYIETP